MQGSPQGSPNHAIAAPLAAGAEICGALRQPIGFPRLPPPDRQVWGMRCLPPDGTLRVHGGCWWSAPRGPLDHSESRVVR